VRIKYRWKKLGGHIHVTMFVTMKVQFQNSGSFVLDAGEEWTEFRLLMSNPRIIFEEAA
jgi:hypothetical protein